MDRVPVDLFIGGLHPRHIARYKVFHEWYRLLPGTIDARLLRHRTPILRWRPYERFVEGVWTPRHVRARRRRGSVLHVPSNLHAYALVARPRSPTVATCHHLMTSGARAYGHAELEDPRREELQIEGLRAADVVVASSDFTRQELVQHLGFPAQRTRTIPLGVDLGRYRPRALDAATRDRLGFAPPPAKNLIYVGTEAPRKNLETALRVLARVREEMDVRLVKVGPPRPPHHERLRTLAKELGVDPAIHWVGTVDEHDVPLYYAAADALLFPTFFEGFGMPVLEAMASGCAVVASDVSSVPEVGGEAGFYAPPGAVEAHARNVLRVLSDEALRRRHVDRGLERAQGLSWQRTADHYAQLYHELVRAS